MDVAQFKELAQNFSRNDRFGSFHLYQFATAAEAETARGKIKDLGAMLDAQSASSRKILEAQAKGVKIERHDTGPMISQRAPGPNDDPAYLVVRTNGPIAQRRLLDQFGRPKYTHQSSLCM